MDRLKQSHRLLHQVRQPAAADLDAGVAQAQVLTVQPQMEGAFVDHHANHETDTGSAALDHADRRWRARQHLRVAALDHAAQVLEHHIAARTLRQPVADFLADHFEVLRRQARSLGVRHDDDFDRHFLVVEEQLRLIAAILRLLGLGFTLVARHPALLARQRLLWHDGEVFAQRSLHAGRQIDPPFALLSEDLSLEPGDLAAQLRDLGIFPIEQSGYLRGRQRRHLHG